VTVSVDEKRHRTTVEGGQGKPISLIIPCRPEYVSLCRLVAGVVGTRESLDEEDIADLKLVVTEACTCFLWGPDGSPSLQDDCPPGGPSSLRVDFKVLPDSWEISISDPEHRYHTPKGSDAVPAVGGGLGLMIIEALVDSVDRTDTEAGGSVVRLVKRLSPRLVEAG
jgi:anti-sigma regulatory factor (Ser/Thr protein kinase)